MTEIILHHYPMSPFAEKIRLIMGYKKLQWSSVIIPAIMPKPDVIALTGGYRRTPILQIGADIYCDTTLIARVLEEIKHVPTLYPARSNAAANAAAAWADQHLFVASVAVAMQPAGFMAMFKSMSEAQLNAFKEDRAAFRKGPVTRPTLSEARATVTTTLQQLESQFAAGEKYIVGDVPSIADFSFYHCLWFILRAGPIADIFDHYPRVHDWLARMNAFGHGEAEDMSSADAVNHARSSTHMGDFVGTPDLPDGVAFGDKVSVSPSDYGIDPTVGELVLARPDEIAIRRVDVRAGEVIVHFPRAGYQVKRADA